MDGVTTINYKNIDSLYISKGLKKIKKLIVFKETTIIEYKGKKLWQQNIDVCDLLGKTLTKYKDGFLGSAHYIKLRKSSILCYKNFFVICNQEIHEKDNGDRERINVCDVYSYSGKQIDCIYKEWKKSNKIIKYYNELANKFDNEISKTN